MDADSDGNSPHGRFDTYIESPNAVKLRAGRLCACQNERR